jgi:2-polyprenyl-3-methyl-5-hydroxy-6-metoxy-1,4-benzoquinol methylase
MSAYGEFADIYAEGPYPRFSARMAQRMPELLREWDVDPDAILDMACGEGTFATAMAQCGYQVTGIDRSPRMIRIAERKAKEAGVEIDFRLRDMSRMRFDECFDLVTCWFDSLNYLVSFSSLGQAFKGAYEALKPGGLFVFDMNTISGLAQKLSEHPARVEWETPDRFVVHQTKYDYEMGMATITITAFVREGELWRRIQESHMEKGFHLWEIRNAVRDAGFRTLATVDSIDEMTKVSNESSRVWYVCQRPLGTGKVDAPPADEGPPLP